KESVGGRIAHPDLSQVEIFDKPDPQEQEYMSQRGSFVLDKVLELNEKYDVYLRLVILEKNEIIFNKMDLYGLPTLEDSNDHFYGTGRTYSGARWLQEAWWRYLQARWGYSTHLHSWELLNEGDPASPNH